MSRFADSSGRMWSFEGGSDDSKLDFGSSRRGQALITRGVVVLGTATAGYSFWLIATIAAKS